MSKIHPPDGCAAMALLSMAIVLFIGIILFLTQKTYIINYFGEESSGKIINIDSIHRGYNKYEFNYAIEEPSGDIAIVSEGNYNVKTHQMGETVKIKTYKGDSDFKVQVPNPYILIPLLLLCAFFVRAYFVFRE